MTAEMLPAQAHDDDIGRRRAVLALLLAIVAVLVAGVLVSIARQHGCSGTVCGNTTSAPPASRPGTGAHGNHPVKATTNTSAGASTASIQVSGSRPARLAPGITSPVIVTVRNTGSRPARITSAGIRVGNASTSCTAGKSIRATRYVAAAPAARQYVVAPHHSAHIPLAISMLDLPSNQNACKNASFPLTFQATAQQG